MRQPTFLYPHDECGCQGKAPIIGSRYRRRSKDALTGADLGWKYFTITDVEPVRHDRIFCRRCTAVSDSGHTWHPDVADFFERYQAVDNVVELIAREEG